MHDIINTVAFVASAAPATERWSHNESHAVPALCRRKYPVAGIARFGGWVNLRIKRPVAGVALLYCVGVLVGVCFPDAPAAFGVSAVVSILAWCALSLASDAETRLLKWAAIFLVFFFVAAFFSARRTLDTSPNALCSVPGKRRESMVIEGTVVDQPRDYSRGPGNRTLLFPMKVEQVAYGSSFRDARGRVRVLLRADGFKGKLPAYGEKWRVFGVLQDRSVDSLVFQRRPPLQWAGRRFAFRANADSASLVSAGHGFCLTCYSIMARNWCAGVLSRGLEGDPDSAAMLRALLLGCRDDLPAESREAMVKAGALHVMAISGLHVGILTAIVAGMLRLAGVPRTNWICGIAPIVLLYVMITGMRPSAVRAGVMACVYFTGPFLNRKPDVPCALAVSALLILVFDPLQMLGYGFIFSFVVVGGLLVTVPRVVGWVDRRLFAEADSFSALDRESVAQRISRPVTAWFAGIVSVSCVAWFFSAPLTACFFNTLTPCALFTNILIVPMVFVVVCAGLCSVLVGWIFPILGVGLNMLCAFLIKGMLVVMKTAGALPFAHFNVESPSIWLVLLWYAGLGVVCLVSWRKAGLFAGVGMMCFACAMWLVTAGLESCIDVFCSGEAGVVHIRSTGLRHVLLNTGPACFAGRVGARLEDQGVNRLNLMVLPDSRTAESGGAAKLIGVFEPARLWIPRSDSRGHGIARALACPGLDTNAVLRIDSDQKSMFAGVEWRVVCSGARPRGDGFMVMEFTQGKTVVLVIGGAGPDVLPFIARHLRWKEIDFVIIWNADTARSFLGNNSGVGKEPACRVLLVGAASELVAAESDPDSGIYALPYGSEFRIDPNASRGQVLHLRSIW